MYNKTQLEERSIDELRAIAKAMKITKTTRMTAQEIIYKILDYQAEETSRPADAPKAAAPARKPRARLKPKPVAESNTNKENGVRTDEVVYLTADEEDNYIVAQANEPLDEGNHFLNKRVKVRYQDQILEMDKDKVDLMDVSPNKVLIFKNQKDLNNWLNAI